MDKLENYIYYSICEKSYELFEDTNFSTYRMYCYTFRDYINLGIIGENEFGTIDVISKHLELIYNIEYKVAVQYIGSYFLDEKYVIFEQPVRLVREYFRNSFN